MALEIFDRLAQCFDTRDWITLACLAGPLLDRLLRTVAIESGIETKFQRERRWKTPPESTSQDRSPVPPRNICMRMNLRNYLTWLTSDPGRNLRNKVGHGYIHLEECEPLMGVQVLYGIIALAFATVASAAASTNSGLNSSEAL